MNEARWVVLCNEFPIAWFISLGDASDFKRAVARIPAVYEIRPV